MKLPAPSLTPSFTDISRGDEHAFLRLGQVHGLLVVRFRCVAADDLRIIIYVYLHGK